MIKYAVWYRPIGTTKWATIEDVIGDGFIGDAGGGMIRFFMTADACRHEVHAHGVEFRFAPERAESVKAAERARLDEQAQRIGGGGKHAV